MATAQACHALTSYYISKYKEVIGSGPLANRNKARWGFDSLLMDYTAPQVKELIDYYIQYYTDPSLDWFLFNYEKVDEALQEHNEKEEQARKRRRETEKRLKEWRERWQN